MTALSPLRFPSSPDQIGGAFGEQFAPWAVVRRSPAPGVWGPAELVRSDQLQVSVTVPALHYGLNCFEGMKGYKNADDSLHLFRLKDHSARLTQSAERLCMQAPPLEHYAADCAAALQANADFVPAYGEGALYLRPLLLGSESYLGVRPSKEHLFVILASPVKRVVSPPIDVTISQTVTRAPRGGIGSAKTGANYAGGMQDALRAKAEGFGHVLFLDAETRTQIVEGLTSNILFVLDDRVVTPLLDDTILHGITRDSCLTLLRGRGMEVEERRIELKDLEAWAAEGRLKEAILVGTAAVVTPVRSIQFGDTKLDIPGGDVCAELLDAYEKAAWKGETAHAYRVPVDAPKKAPSAPLAPTDHSSAWLWAEAWAGEWQRRDFEALGARFDADCYYHSPMVTKLRGTPVLLGRGEMTRHWESSTALLHSLDFEVQQVVFDGRQIVIQYLARVNGFEKGQVSVEIFRFNSQGLVDHVVSAVGA